MALHTYNIGSGGDFENPALALNYIQALASQEEYILNIISNITWESGGSYYQPKNSDSKIKITCSHNEVLRNDQSQWYTLTCTDNYPALLLTPYSYWSLCEVEYLKFLNCYSNSIYFGRRTSDGSIISKCVFIMTLSSVVSAIHLGTDGQNYATICNCLSYDGSIINNNVGGTTYDPSLPRRKMYNCIVCSKDTSAILIPPLSNVLNVVIKNVFAFSYNSGVVTFQDNGSTVNVDYCATDNNSISGGTGNVTDVNYLNELLSIDINSPNFLKPKSDSTIKSLGTDPSSVISSDFSGINYASPFPIGAYQYVIAIIHTGYKILNIPTIGFKHESIPYKQETLSSSDYHYSINSDIKIQPNIESYFQNICTGDFSNFPSISGKRLCAINFSINLYTMTDLTIAPSYFDILESCGWKKISIINGVKIFPDSLYNSIPSTIEVVYPEENDEPDQIVYKISGAMGMVKFTGETGKPIKAEFSFIGSLEKISTRLFADMITPNNFDDSVPFVLLGSSFKLFNTDLALDKFEINSGEIINLFSNIMKSSGYDGARIIDSFIAGKLNVYEDPGSLNTLYSRIVNNNEGKLELISGNFTFNIENIKITSANDKFTELDFEGINGLSIEQKEPEAPCIYDCYYLLTNCNSALEPFCKEITELPSYGSSSVIADFSNGWMNLKWLGLVEISVTSSEASAPIQSLPAGNWGYSFKINFKENSACNPSNIFFGIYNGSYLIHGFRFYYYYSNNQLVVNVIMNESTILTLDRNNQNDIDHRITFIKLNSTYYAFIDDLQATGAYNDSSDALIIDQKFKLIGYGGKSESYQSEVNIKEIIVISPYEAIECTGELTFICGIE